jgi:hypothetical protein
MPKATITVYRKPRSDLSAITVEIAADQAVAPLDAGLHEHYSLTRAEARAIADGWRSRGYSIEWRVGGYRE